MAGQKQTVAKAMLITAMWCATALCFLLPPGILQAKDFTFSWSPNPEPVQGYRLYYKVGGAAGPPFDGKLSANGPSPINVGKVTTFTITGLAEYTTYHFALTAYNGSDESGYSATISALADEIPLQAVIASSGQEGEQPYRVSFNGFASTGSIISYLWNFDDGNTASGPNVNHIFRSSGSYNTTLTVVDGKGRSHQASQLITVTAPPEPAPPPPQPPPENPVDDASDGSGDTDQTPLRAAITTSGIKGEAPYTVMFDAGSSSGPISAYAWAFGDGDTASGSAVSHRFNYAGSYTTTLTVYDQAGDAHQATVGITVSSTTGLPAPAVAPTAVIASSAAVGVAPLVVQFDGSASTTAQPPLISYFWTFGDGTTASKAVANHVYTTPGSYKARLTVTDSAGLSSLTSIPILVSGQSSQANQPPLASFTASPELGIPPLTIFFDATASSDLDGSISKFLWSFGDGSTSSGPTAQYRYKQLGQYTVTLTVIDELGLSSSTSKTINVIPQAAYAAQQKNARALLVNILNFLLVDQYK